MVWPAAQSFLYPPPPSAFVTAMTIGTVLQAGGGLLEVRGSNMRYSKFWNTNSPARDAWVPSRTGMLALYAPAFLSGAASFWLFPAGEGLRFILVRSSLTLHFLKRILEVLFVHKFSGFMAVDSMIVISLGYFLFAATSIYALHLSCELLEPAIDLTYPGLSLFLIGISGNLYHHLILSGLRSDQGEKEYRIPKGGLFGLVACPHYLFEIVGFVGISLMSQTIYSFASTLAMGAYLTGRSYATRRWYRAKFEDFPGHVKAILPFIF